MPLIYYVQNSTVGIVLVSVMLFHVLGQGGRRQAQDSLFIALLFSTLFIIVAELLVDVFSGATFNGSRFVITLVTYMFYILNPIPSVLYLLYLDQLRRRWVYIPKRIGIIAFTPAIIGFLLTTVSLFNGIIYSIDAQNIYHRGNYFFLIVICDLICLFFGLIYLIYYRDNFRKRDLSLFLFFPIPVLIAAFLQANLYGIEVVGLSLALTMLIVYLHMQSSHAHKDYLTLLYNRGVSEKYLHHLLLNKKRKKKIVGVMMDINNFKHVNDMYGHNLGDSTLRYFAQLLSHNFKDDWFIGRYGGDEFILFKEVYSTKDIDTYITHFKECLISFNIGGDLPFPLSVSTGIATILPLETMNVADFIKLLDTRMYDDKRAYHGSSLSHPPFSTPE